MHISPADHHWSFRDYYQQKAEAAREQQREARRRQQGALASLREKALKLHDHNARVGGSLQEVLQATCKRIFEDVQTAFDTADVSTWVEKPHGDLVPVSPEVFVECDAALKTLGQVLSPKMQWIGGGVTQGDQPMPSYCLPDANCQ